MSAARRVLPSLFLAFLLGASILAVQPTEAFPVSASQQATVRSVYGAGIPPDGWQTRLQTSSLYLYSEPTGGPVSGSPPGAPPAPYTVGTPDSLKANIQMPLPTGELDSVPVIGTPVTEADATSFKDPSDRQVLIGLFGGAPTAGSNPAAVKARFVLADTAVPVDRVTISEIAPIIYASCDSRALTATVSVPGGTTQTLPGGIMAHLDQERFNAETESWAVNRTLSNNLLRPSVSEPGVIQVFQLATPRVVGNPVLGSGDGSALVLQPGIDRLVLRLEMPALTANANLGNNFPSGECILHYGSRQFNSRVNLKDDSARLATFTQDLDGNEATGFPRGSAVDSAHRQINVVTLQANPWGDSASQVLRYETNVRLRDVARNAYVYYVEDFDDALPLERDISDVDLKARSDEALTTNLVRRTFAFNYPPTLNEGDFQVEFYAEDQRWELQGTTFKIGGRGIGLDLASGESATHLINPQEPTEFTFVVRNIGAEDDVVTVTASDPAGGWTARVLGGGQYLLAPGHSTNGTVELIPPATAVAGTEGVLRLHASSRFPDVADPAELTLKGRITAEHIPGVAIDAATDEFSIKPGQTKGYAVTVTNTGTSRDSFVVIPVFPSNVPGWSVTVVPSSMQLVAGARSPLNVLVTAPASAPSGTSFPLGLVAAEVGNAAVSDRIDLSVVVLVEEGLFASTFEQGTNRTLRQQAEECSGSAVQDANEEEDTDLPACEEGVLGRIDVDSDFDDSALFRIPVQNLGDREDRYKVEAYWDTTAAGTSNDNGCDGDSTASDSPSADGVPDGWRFNWGADVEDPIPAGRQRAVGFGWHDDADDGFSGYYQLQTAEDPLVVPARSTSVQYVEVGHVDVACSGGFVTTSPPELWLFPHTRVGPDSSSTARLVLRVTSLTDASRVVEFPATVTMDGPALRLHDVDVGLDRGQSGKALAGPGAAGAFNPAVFNLTAVNKGNEHDNLRIAVTGHPGWAHEIVVTGETPSSISCDPPTNNGATVRCNGVGVYDDVRFQVKATPDDDVVAVGDSEPITVTVFSTDSAGAFDTQILEARAAGTLAFAAKPLGSTTRNVTVGQSVAFPLLIQNQGTQDDSYRITFTQGDAWSPVVSTSAPLFVPAGHEAPAYVSVTPPDSTAAGTQGEFTVQVASVGSINRKLVDLIAIARAPGALVLEGADGPDVLLDGRGVVQDVTVEATKVTGAAGDTITFTVDKASLPADWIVDDGESDTDKAIVRTLEAQSSGASTATATFKVTAPANALGNGRAILHVDAVTSSALKAATDIGLNLESTQGVALEVPHNATQVIAADGSVIYNLTVRNLGLGEDTVSLTNSLLPTGWSLLLNPPTVSLGPLQALDVTAKLTAPATARPGDVASVVVFASSREDPLQIASQVLRAEVGFNAIRMEAVGGVPAGAPQETVSRVINVTNTGTLPDEVQLSSRLETTGLGSKVEIGGGPTLFSLEPGQTKQIVAEAAFRDGVPSDSTVQWNVTANSLRDARPVAQRANASLPIAFRVLPYVSSDVNGDSIPEYAVDRNDEASDGFEEFKATTTPGGRPLQTAEMESFLRDDAREKPCGTPPCVHDVTLEDGTTQRVFVYTIDGDEDGKVDQFLDKDGDGQPDFYWDPDANQASPIEFRKDINGDQVPESFVDTDGDGEQDRVFDLTRGEFTDVLKVDVDGDCQLKDEGGESVHTAAECLDYVIDKNGNGEVDSDETVLFTRSGGLLIVQIVDVDGDDKDDQVFDVDGDGNPDYFIPSGSGESVEISMRDVNGDGTQDWTFDGDGDGRKESYYDPVTGQAHVIDAAGHFVDALRKYWYVGALFALVVVLFVALVLVTRR